MAEPHVLELRIHGIANSPPAQMLCVKEDHVERVTGDEYGSFWVASEQSDAPEQVRVEAYSWGNLARSGGSALAVIGRAFVHLGWLFVLPFGLCNLAYWARRNIPGEERASRWWDGGPGAIGVRMFALLQTLFYVAAFMSVSVDLIAMQCLDDQTPCAALPSWFDTFARLEALPRAALFSTVPILLIVLIYLIGLRARGSFDPNTDLPDTTSSTSAGDDEKPRNTGRWLRGDRPEQSEFPPLLASKGFWRRSKVAQATERSHLAASISLVLLLLAWDAWIGDSGSGSEWDPAAWFAFDRGGEPVAFIAVVAATALLAGSVGITAVSGLTHTHWSFRSKRAWATVALIASTLAYLAWLVWAFLPSSASIPDDGRAQGLIITPGVIATICALIAVASLTWGCGWQRWIAWILLTGAFTVVIVAEVWQAEHGPVWRAGWSWAAVALTGTAVAAGYLLRSRSTKLERKRLGWHGNGAAVALLVALFTSLVITSLMVVGAHAWLAASAESPKITGHQRELPKPRNGDLLDAPDFYERFAVVLLAVLIILILLAATAAGTALRRFARYTVPTLAAEPGPQPSPDRNRAGTDGPGPGYPTTLDEHDEKDRKVVSARRVASLAHRGEPMLRWLAILTAVALVPLTVPLFGEQLQMSSAWASASGLANWALGLLALAAVAWVVSNAATSTERPLGLVWDIICFFPRAGHPFTPPCYAERTVPELQERIGDWLHAEGGDHRRIILSAHSMGGTLAVATLFAMHAAEHEDAGHQDACRAVALRDEDHPDTRRMALLTYGVQLRAYFSRFFPEVFGAQVLGVPGTLGPSLLGLDPWKKQVVQEWADRHQEAPEPEEPPSLTELLGADPRVSRAPRWRSLWRRTDYLGFPVSGYRTEDNPIDRGATERSPRTYLWTVARHNGYLETAQYAAARRELLDRFAADAAAEPHHYVI
ncbi:hypothetical protein [Agromyces sp. LHK192]|uniref:hypothetical protein n=1 Tax=Agromyces sp. LHK192 TaxID=2498704 RepID=UPI000FDAB97D|nr:hypothetical protein [Agromyces sp. LHK192]